MADVVIRDTSETVLAAIDQRAEGLGISRNEYLHRLLEQDNQTANVVTNDDFRRVGQLTSDLADPEVMKQAWS